MCVFITVFHHQCVSARHFTDITTENSAEILPINDWLKAATYCFLRSHWLKLRLDWKTINFSPGSVFAAFLCRLLMVLRPLIIDSRTIAPG